MGGAPPIPPDYNISELIHAFPHDDWGRGLHSSTFRLNLSAFCRIRVH
jgi:hypothetical protein